MAIKGMTDQEKELPKIGVIRKGAPKTTNAPGKDLTYFRFVPEDEDAKNHFEAAYPGEPRSIEVFLPYVTPEENFINSTWIEKWGAGGLEYRSDGDTVVQWRMANGQYSFEPKPDPKPEVGEDGKRADGSRYVGRLTVIIPELGRFATVTVLTTSKNDVVNLSKQLKSYYALSKDLRGIPFILTRRKMNISTPTGDGGRGRRDSWLLCIETKPDYSRLLMADAAKKALPDSVDDEDIKVIEATGWQELPEPDEDDLIDLENLPTDESPFGDDSEFEEIESVNFANLDDLLFQANQDFGLSESDAKAILKEYGHKGFKASKSHEMYRDIIAHMKSVEVAESILDNQ